MLDFISLHAVISKCSWLQYGKCSKVSNTFLFLFSNKMMVIKAEIQKNA